MPDCRVWASATPLPGQSPRPQTQPLPARTLPAMVPSMRAVTTVPSTRDPAAREQDGDTDGDDDQRPEPPDTARLPGIEPAQSVGQRDAAEQDEEDPPEQVAAMDAHGLATDAGPIELPLDAPDGYVHDGPSAARCPVWFRIRILPEADSQPGVWEDPP